MAGAGRRAGARSRATPLIGCLGHLNPNKRIPQLLDAFVRLRATRPGARLVLAGSSAARFDLDGWLARFGLLDDRRSSARDTSPRSGCGR